MCPPVRRGEWRHPETEADSLKYGAAVRRKLLVMRFSWASPTIGTDIRLHNGPHTVECNREKLTARLTFNFVTFWRAYPGSSAGG